MKFTAYVEHEKKAGRVPNLREAFDLGKTLYTTTSPDGDKGELLYGIAEYLVNRWMGSSYGVGWDDLPDTNSLWDAVEIVDKRTLFEKFKRECQSVMKERLEEVRG